MFDFDLFLFCSCFDLHCNLGIQLLPDGCGYILSFCVRSVLVFVVLMDFVFI